MLCTAAWPAWVSAGAWGGVQGGGGTSVGSLEGLSRGLPQREQGWASQREPLACLADPVFAGRG